MGQAEIIDLLSRGIPMVGREIADTLKQDFKNVIKQITKLLEQEEIHCIEIDRFKAKEHFNCKRKLRLYYIDYNHLRKARATLPYLK
jgi:hypothetical protein